MGSKIPKGRVNAIMGPTNEPPKEPEFTDRWGNNTKEPIIPEGNPDIISLEHQGTAWDVKSTPKDYTITRDLPMPLSFFDSDSTEPWEMRQPRKKISKAERRKRTKQKKLAKKQRSKK